MQFTTILSFAIVAGVSSAASLMRRQGQATTYAVSNFDAECIPHSSQCLYNFTVSGDSTTTLETTCGATVTSDSSLPAVPLTGCADPAWAFFVTKSNSSLSLSITTQSNARSNLTGKFDIPASDLVTNNNGASTSQAYTGATAFNLTVTSTPV